MRTPHPVGEGTDIPAFGQAVGGASTRQPGAEAAVATGEVVSLALAGQATGQPPVAVRMPVGDQAGNVLEVAIGQRLGAGVGHGLQHRVTSSPVFVAEQGVDPVGVGVPVGEAQLEAVLVTLGRTAVEIVQQIVVAHQGRPVTVELARQADGGQPAVVAGQVRIGLCRGGGACGTLTAGVSPFQPVGDLPAFVGLPLDAGGDGGGAAVGAVEDLQVLGARLQRQAGRQAPDVADTVGPLRLAGADGVIHAVFAVEGAIFHVLGVQTEHEGIAAVGAGDLGAGLRVGDGGTGGHAGQAGVPFVAAEQARLFLQAVAGAQGCALVFVVIQVLLHLGADAPAVGGQDRQAQLGSGVFHRHASQSGTHAAAIAGAPAGAGVVERLAADGVQRGVAAAVHASAEALVDDADAVGGREVAGRDQAILAGVAGLFIDTVGTDFHAHPG